MAPPELVELRKQLKDLLNLGYICRSDTPFSALVLFKKKDLNEFHYGLI